MHFQFGADLGGHILPVGLVTFGQNHLFQTKPRCRQDFFLDAAYAQDPAAQTDFTGHGEIGAYPAPRQQGGERGDYWHTRAWSVLGRRPGRNVNVKIAFAVILEIQL